MDSRRPIAGAVPDATAQAVVGRRAGQVARSCRSGFSRDALFAMNPKVPGGVVAGDHFESPPEIVFVKIIPGNHLRAPAPS